MDRLEWKGSKTKSQNGKQHTASGIRKYYFVKFQFFTYICILDGTAKSIAKSISYFEHKT